MTCNARQTRPNVEVVERPTPNVFSIAQAAEPIVDARKMPSKAIRAVAITVDLFLLVISMGKAT